MRRGRHGREAVGQSDRSASLQSGGLDHANGPGQLGAERRSKRPQYFIGSLAAVVALYAVIDLDEVDPADHRARVKDFIEAG